MPSCDVSALLLTAEEAELACAALPRRLARAIPQFADREADVVFLKARLLAFFEAIFELGVGIYPTRVRLLNSAPLGLTVREADLLQAILQHRLQHDPPTNEHVAGALEHVLRKLSPVQAPEDGEGAAAPGSTLAACSLCSDRNLAAMIGAIALAHGPPLRDAHVPLLDERGEVALDRLERRLRALRAFLGRHPILEFGEPLCGCAFAWTPREHVLTLTHLRVATKGFQRRPDEVPLYSATNFPDLDRTLALVESSPFIPVAAL